MKILVVLFGVCCLLSFSCHKTDDKEIQAFATIQKDCSGTYVRVNEHDDYYVCNTDKTESFRAGARVNVLFSKVFDCGLAQVTPCDLLHQNKCAIVIKTLHSF